MHATQLLNTHLYKQCQGIHKKRWAALMATVNALTQGKKLSVTGLGRAMKSEAYQKHNIKRVDRLIGNALQPVALPSRNLQHTITRALLHSTTGVNEQFPGRDFNPLDSSPVTACVLTPIFTGFPKARRKT